MINCVAQGQLLCMIDMEFHNFPFFRLACAAASAVSHQNKHVWSCSQHHVCWPPLKHSFWQPKMGRHQKKCSSPETHRSFFFSKMRKWQIHTKFPKKKILMFWKFGWNYKLFTPNNQIPPTPCKGSPWNFRCTSLLGHIGFGSGQTYCWPH